MYCFVEQPRVVLAHPQPVPSLVARVQPTASTESQARLGVHGQENLGAVGLPLRVLTESV
ncbi:hypothetical protein [Micromonospora sp. NPDC049679]|uniref:hypothetical protein n=1 Tax=Micromonospora sp. NPDC049679 TaxID=3155920 RepID=UPI0033D6DB27